MLTQTSAQRPQPDLCAVGGCAAGLNRRCGAVEVPLVQTAMILALLSSAMPRPESGQLASQDLRYGDLTNLCAKMRPNSTSASAIWPIRGMFAL